MSDKVKVVQPIRSFADLPRNAVVTVEAKSDPKMYVPWDATGMALTVIGKSAAVDSLMNWLKARLAELNRQKISMDDISVVHHGNRTVIRVLGKDRYEFKIKVQMEER